MMHQPLGGLGGASRRRQAGRADGAHQAADGRADRPPLGPAGRQIVEDSERDKWFSAEEAKDYGIVDHVVTSAAQVTGGGGTA